MEKMLERVTAHGTAAKVKYLYQVPGAVGGKTGTTQNYSDGWFIGITSTLATGIWTGFEDRAIHFRSMSLGSGSAMAMPIFGTYMKNALSDTSREMRSEQVPISVRSSDIPNDIELGEAINIYWVPEAMGMQKVGEPALVISGAYLRSIDRKSANFGTDVALTISVFSREIFALLSATSTGRLVVVRSNG
jgi:membrane carboxypeptidase/penicillin-binding protein